MTNEGSSSIVERWGSTYSRKMVEIRLRWFGHVERRPMDFAVRRVDQMEGSQITRCREDLEKL